MTHLWVLEKYYPKNHPAFSGGVKRPDDGYCIETFYSSKEWVQKQLKIRRKYSREKFRISKFVREVPRQALLKRIEKQLCMKTDEFIKFIEKAQKATEKSKLRFP